VALPEWQRAYFIRPGVRSRFPLMSSPAPEPETPSDALVESRAEMARRNGRDREHLRRRAHELAGLREQFAREQRERDIADRWRSMSPERRQQMREDVSRFGREAVVGMMRRITDAEFDLPADLNEEG